MQFRHTSDKTDIRKVKHILPGSQIKLNGCFKVGLQKQWRCRHGKVWLSSISFSRTLSQSRETSQQLGINYLWK